MWEPPRRIVAAPPGAKDNLYIYEEEIDEPLAKTPICPPSPIWTKGPPLLPAPSPSTSGYGYQLSCVDVTGRFYRTAWGGLRGSPRLPNRFAKAAAGS